MHYKGIEDRIVLLISITQSDSWEKCEYTGDKDNGVNLKDYIRGQRQGKAANELERKAMYDPFLQDAIDGYDSVEGGHLSVIENLEKRLSSPKKRINKTMWIWAVAAVMILLIGTPLLLYKPYTKEEITGLSSDIIQQKKEITTPLLQKDTVLAAYNFEPKKEDDTTPKAKQTPSSSLPAETYPEIIKPVAEVFEVPENRVSAPDKELRLSTVQDDVAEKMLIKEPQRNIVETLAGRVAGIAVSEREQDKNIRIRGISPSIPQSDKLFISGRIVDETGEPLAGAIIQLPNTLSGTVSDTAGNFRLTVPKEAQGTLLASYIGMKETEIPLKEDAGDITMKANEMALNETVVIGYGVQKKRLFARSASSVTAGEIFGEEEFRQYFIENYDKGICEGQKIIIVVEFFIDPIGRPANIDIKENSCPALDYEIKRLLLGSPPWSKINRKISLQIELP